MKKDKEVKSDIQNLRTVKKSGKNGIMGKMVAGLLLDEIEQYKNKNRGMVFSLDQLYTAKLEEIIEDKMTKGEKPEDIKSWLGLRMSARKVDMLMENYQIKNPMI